LSAVGERLGRAAATLRGRIKPFAGRILGSADRRSVGAANGDLFPIPADFDDASVALVRRVQPFTLTTPERIVALRDAVRWIVRAEVPGAIAECGVWRGGSMQVVALTLVELGVTDRELWMYDTFDEMPPPGDEDRDLSGRLVREVIEEAGEADPIYAYLPFDEVRAALEATGYPPERMHWVKGMVEDTIPATMPDELALLRLDTDWYRSTRHELTHLGPRLSPDAVLLIDDYGHFSGAQQAVDEYLATQPPVHLHRVDYSARLAIMPAPRR
jgi:hypothetical protein